MALSVVSMGRAGNTANQSTAYATGSITSTVGTWLLLYVAGTAASITWTVSGLSLTWTQRARTTVSTTASLQVFTAFVSSGSTGTISITPSGSATGCAYSVIQVTGADTGDVLSGTAVIPTSGTTVSSLAVGTPTQSSANNHPIVAVATTNNTANTISPPAGWIELDEVVYATPGQKIWVGWASASYPSTVTITEDSTYDLCGMGLQLAEPALVSSYRNVPENRAARFRAANW